MGTNVDVFAIRAKKYVDINRLWKFEELYLPEDVRRDFRHSGVSDGKLRPYVLAWEECYEKGALIAFMSEFPNDIYIWAPEIGIRVNIPPELEAFTEWIYRSR